MMLMKKKKGEEEKEEYKNSFTITIANKKNEYVNM